MERNRQRHILAVLCLAQLAFILDISVVNVALVPLADDLKIGRAGLQLVAAVYAAAFGGGLVLFAASSALCGQGPAQPC
jgi:MFS family permease